MHLSQSLCRQTIKLILTSSILKLILWSALSKQALGISSSAVSPEHMLWTNRNVAPRNKLFITRVCARPLRSVRWDTNTTGPGIFSKVSLNCLEYKTVVEVITIKIDRSSNLPRLGLQAGIAVGVSRDERKEIHFTCVCEGSMLGR